MIPVPRQSPDLVAGLAILSHRTQVRDARWGRRIDAQHREILYVLGKQERSSFQHQHSVAVGLVDVKTRCASTEPKLPPPITITSNGRASGRIEVSALRNASSSPLQMYRPTTSRLKSVVWGIALVGMDHLWEGATVRPARS